MTVPSWAVANGLVLLAASVEGGVEDRPAMQAMAIGRLFTIASRFTDPDAYFVGGGVAETVPE